MQGETNARPEGAEEAGDVGRSQVPDVRHANLYTLGGTLSGFCLTFKFYLEKQFQDLNREGHGPGCILERCPSGLCEN